MTGERGLAALAAVPLLVLACALTASCAAVGSSQRSREYAALPDWTGLWEADLGPENVGASLSGGGPGSIPYMKLIAPPPYKREWRLRYEAAMRDTRALASAAAKGKVCTYGFPAILESFGTFEWGVTPKEVFNVHSNGDVRRIYTDGRGHPGKDDLWPTPLGDSIGHWEGQTLVIDTIARKSGPISPFGPMALLSDEARFTERVRMVDPNRMEDELTIEDPVAFVHPWVVTIAYRRVHGLDRIIPYDCLENDRNPVVNGRLTINPPD